MIEINIYEWLDMAVNYNLIITILITLAGSSLIIFCLHLVDPKSFKRILMFSGSLSLILILIILFPSINRPLRALLAPENKELLVNFDEYITEELQDKGIADTVTFSWLRDPVPGIMRIPMNGSYIIEVIKSGQSQDYMMSIDGETVILEPINRENKID